MVYTKERKFAGLPLGMIYADATLGSMLIAEKRHRRQVLDVAIRTLWSRRFVYGIRMLLSPGGLEESVFKKTLSCLDTEVHYAPVENHCILDLPASYECFLQVLGRQTRRNFRYYRRRFESAGHTYVGGVSMEDFKQAALHLLA